MTRSPDVYGRAKFHLSGQSGPDDDDWEFSDMALESEGVLITVAGSLNPSSACDSLE